MAGSHVMVVHDVRKVIGGKSVRFNNHRVTLVGTDIVDHSTEHHVGILIDVRLQLKSIFKLFENTCNYIKPTKLLLLYRT